MEALVALDARCRLEGVVDPVLARPDAGVERRPGRDVELVGGGAEQAVRALVEQRRQPRQPAAAGALEQQRAVAELEPDHQCAGVIRYPDQDHRAGQDDQRQRHVGVDRDARAAMADERLVENHADHAPELQGQRPAALAR